MSMPFVICIKSKSGHRHEINKFSKKIENEKKKKLAHSKIQHPCTLNPCPTHDLPTQQAIEEIDTHLYYIYPYSIGHWQPPPPLPCANETFAHSPSYCCRCWLSLWCPSPPCLYHYHVHPTMNKGYYIQQSLSFAVAYSIAPAKYKYIFLARTACAW